MPTLARIGVLSVRLRNASRNGQEAQKMLFGVLVSRFHSDEQFVPFVMFPRFGGAASGKGLVELFDFRGLVGHDTLPVGKLFAAGAAHLIREELDDVLVNSVVVRFDDPFLVSIAKPKQASLTDRFPEQGIDFRLGFW
jgi:hypothetical protein